MEEIRLIFYCPAQNFPLLLPIIFFDRLQPMNENSTNQQEDNYSGQAAEERMESAEAPVSEQSEENLSSEDSTGLPADEIVHGGSSPDQSADLQPEVSAEDNHSTMESVREETDVTASSDSEENVSEIVSESIDSEAEPISLEETSSDSPEPESVKELISAESTETPEIIEKHFQKEDANAPELEIVHVEDAELEAMESVEAEIQPEDYSGLDKEQLVKLAEQLNRDPDPVLAGKVIQKIRPLFDALFLKEKQEALEKFVAEGGQAETFEFKHQQLEQRINQAQKGINDKRRISQESQAKERARNLEQKLSLLEQLRLLVDDHEHTPGYEKFKAIREEWKKIGPVGQEHAQNLNASFFSLIDRFHSLSEIYHNLRDFDRKKNLELKQEIVARIEKLADEALISKAMKELISLQEEFRTIGPVPNDKFEELKARMKAAADVIFERRRSFNEERKGQIQEEISLKDALLEKITGFDEFVASTAKEWQEKTKELMQLQDEWRAIPGRFREKTAEQGKQFWGIFKKYMSNKNDFFKTLDKGRKDVLAAKQALVEEVNSLKDGEDWDGITNRMKELQSEWKKIAPIFSKEGQKVYDEFKAGIDHFFNRLRDRRSGEDKVQTDNLNAKDAICAEIEAMAADGKGDKSNVEAFREKFRNIGHVPSKQMQRINGRFSKALMTLIDASSDIAEQDKERLKIQILSSRSTYSTEGVKQLKNQESYIQKRLQQLRKDAGNLEDNIAMFKMSKNAMAMMEDFRKRINLYQMEIRELEAQLREIRNTEKAENQG